MSTLATFTPFNIECYNKLKERFEHLFEPELINQICLNGKVKTFRANEVLMDIGQPLTHMPIVIEGSLKIMTEDEHGNELLLYYLELGDTCAVTLNCCTKPGKSSVRAVTETPAEVLFLPIGKMEEWMISYRSWRQFVLDSYNIRLSEMLSAIDTLAFNNMEERILKYLKDKAMIQRNTKLIITHNEIANELHSSRVVIPRNMKKLKNDKKIVQHRNEVDLKLF